MVLASKKIHVSDIAYYHYIRRVTSATATASLSKTLDAINACREAIGEIELSSAALREKRWLKQFVTNTVYSTLQYYKKLDMNDRKAFREEMYKNLDLMGYPSKPKFLLLKSCLIIFGIDTTLGIMLKI